MQRLIALLLDSDKNREIMDDTYNTYARAPRAYNRAIGVLLSMRERHPWCMSVSLARRKGPASSAGNPATLIVASRSGVFNDRGWEARIPVIEHEGEILIDDRDEIGMLLANSNKSGSAGYLYAYPMRLRALLGAAAVAILHIANDASMQSGRTEYRSDGQGWTPVFYPKDRYEQLELLTWWFGEQKERFHKEAHEERKYVAFRTSENEDGNGMIVKGIRKRELNPAPFDRNYMTHEYTERSTEIEALASLGHDEAMSLIAGLEDNAYHAVTEVLSSRWIEVNFEASAQRFLDAKYELTIETEGVWKHPHFNNSSDDINLKLLIRFEEQPDESRAICGKGTMTGNCNGNKFAQHVEGPVAEALFREFAVKRGIVVACKRGLVELDERNGSDVPLNEREISYEEYLRLGLEEFIKVLNKAESVEEELPADDSLGISDADTTSEGTSEAPASDAAALPAEPEPLADWERELLDDPVDPRREVAETVAKVSAVHPWQDTLKVEDVNELVASPKPSDYLFEEVVSWLRTYVEPGYPVIFKGDASSYITEHMVAYLQRPQGKADIFGLQETKLAEGVSILTHVGKKEAVKVTVDEGPNCIALSFNKRLRRIDVRDAWFVFTNANVKEQAFEQFMDDVRASKEPVFYFVAGSDNKTRKSLVDGREFLATSLTPADILYIARQRGVTMPAMVVEKALPGQRGLLVRTNITK